MKRQGNRRCNTGFTLIEMLIVVAVIAILSSVVLVGIAPVRARARDSRRLSDLRQVQNALELYFSKCGYYPGSAQSGVCIAFPGAAANWTELTAALTGSNIGVNKIPNDPSAGKTYFYGTNGAGSSYVVAAQLEDVNNSVLSSSDSGTGITLSGSAVCNTSAVYCIQF
jgi:general secretion pathway protein G